MPPGWDTPDPLLALLAGLVILGASSLLFWPRGGLIGRRRRARQLSARVLREHALKHIGTAELESGGASVRSVVRALEIGEARVDELLGDLERRSLVRREGESVRLTPSGRDYALHLIRTHRLWERYLADRTGLSETEWHREADRLEHLSSPGEVNDLSARLGNPTHDPHGDPIPTETGDVVQGERQPLSEAPDDRALRILHIEDEPEAVYTQIVAESLSPGMVLRILEKTAQRIRFWAEGAEHVLAPALARNISVAPVSDAQFQPLDSATRLSSLRQGQEARVVHISRACRGAERRRLLDLGFVPGTLVEVEMVSPVRDPTAYRVRGTLIALRREQADRIQVEHVSESPDEKPT